MPDEPVPAPAPADAAPASTDDGASAAPPPPSPSGPQEADQAQVPTNAARPPPSPGGEADQAPHRAPAFLRLVQAWANGQDVPDNPTIKGCLEDLRACLGERTQVQQQVQQLENTLREQQAQLFASQGREDALLRVCFRAQAH